MSNVPDTCTYDLQLELMKLSVKAGSSSFYTKASKKLREKLSWGEKKFTRVINRTDQMDEMETTIATYFFKELEENLNQKCVA